MIKCPSCDENIDEDATVCPHCGMNDPTGKRARILRIEFLLFFGFILIVLVYASFYLSTHM